MQERQRELFDARSTKRQERISWIEKRLKKCGWSEIIQAGLLLDAVVSDAVVV